MHTTRPQRLSMAVALALLMMASGGAAAREPTSAEASAATPTPRPDDPSDGRWLLYQRDAAQRTEVSLVRLDGSEVRSPLSGLVGGDQTNPDWDPTGTRVTFTMTDGDGDDLWVADVDGSRATRLLDCASPCRWIDDPSWSPDGERIVYSRTVERGTRGIGTLETVEVETGRTAVLVGPAARTFTSGARWSPDGRRVVFELVHKVGPGLEAEIDGVVLSVLSTETPNRPTRALTPPELFAATADWSRDGRRIVYSALADPAETAPDLFTIAPRGGAPTRVTRLAARPGGFAAEPTWSGDGRQIVFSGRADPSGPPLLLTVAATGGPVTSATGDVQTPGRHPRLQP